MNSLKTARSFFLLFLKCIKNFLSSRIVLHLLVSMINIIWLFIFCFTIQCCLFQKGTFLLIIGTALSFCGKNKGQHAQHRFIEKVSIRIYINPHQITQNGNSKHFVLTCSVHYSKPFTYITKCDKFSFF